MVATCVYRRGMLRIGRMAKTVPVSKQGGRHAEGLPLPDVCQTRPDICTEERRAVAISDAAPRIRNVGAELQSGLKFTVIPDPRHAVEYGGAALREPCPERAERKEWLEAVGTDPKAGRVGCGHCRTRAASSRG